MAESRGGPVATRPLGPGAYHELRVHGVAGSPPEGMLGLRARFTGADVAPTRSDGHVATAPGDISVWRPPDVAPHLRAWSWGSLTSGRWYQAFYLLLLPFMIANLAGWMLVARRWATPETGADVAARPDGQPPDADRRDLHLRVSTLLVRLGGLLVTVVFVVSFQLVLADLVFWQWLFKARDWPLWTVGLGPLATAGAFLATILLTRIRKRPERTEVDPWANDRDPVGLGFLQRRQDLLWDSPGINVTLRRLHLAAGLAVIALLAAWPSGEVVGSWAWVRPAAFGLALAAMALAVGLLAWISLGDGAAGMGTAMTLVRHSWPVAAVATVLAALAPLGLAPATAAGWTTLPALRGAAYWVTAAVLAAAAVLALVGLAARRGRQAVNAPAMLLIAASVGAAFGAGLAHVTARQLGGDCGPDRPCFVLGEQVGWLAIGVTTSMAVLVAAVGVRGFLLWRRERSGLRAAHRLTHRGTWITVVLGGTGALLAAVGLVVALVRGGLPPPAAFPAVLAAAVVALLVGPLVAGALVVAWTLTRRAKEPWHRPAAVGAVALAAVAVAVAWRNGWSVTVLGVPLPPRTFAEFALDAAILLPGAALLTRVYSGLTDRGVRRGVGVLWDVGTFWPRWFHPLAPPTYSDRAVRQLAAQLDADLGAGRTLLLAPHSQGAVIAATAVLGGPDRPGLAMLSHGSPWQHLYAEFFPAQVNGTSTRAVADRLRGGGQLRWRNLHRDTDPIGGPVDGVEDTAALPDPDHHGHSDYGDEPAYRVAAETLRGMLEHPPITPVRSA